MTQPDPWASQIAIDLLDCLCDVLAAQPYLPVCRCCIRHSQDLPPMDFCDCTCTAGNPPRDGNGEAWLQFVTDGDSRSQGRAQCGPGLLVLHFRIGIYRCIKGLISDQGVPPDCDTVTADALLLMGDAAALRKAVLCCDALENFDPVIGPYQAIGPLGGCAGGARTITLARVP